METTAGSVLKKKELSDTTCYVGQEVELVLAFRKLKDHIDRSIKAPSDKLSKATR